MELLNAYIGRDNVEQFQLLQDGSEVTASAVTRAVLESDAFCVDSDIHPDIIFFEDENKILCIRPGLLPDIVPNDSHKCHLTIWDGLTVNGFAWGDIIKIKTKSWDICDT